MQGLKKVRELREGKITIQVDNGERVTTVAIRTYSLRLPSGFSLILKDCYYASVVSRNLISVSILI